MSSPIVIPALVGNAFFFFLNCYCAAPHLIAGADPEVVVDGDEPPGDHEGDDGEAEAEDDVLGAEDVHLGRGAQQGDGGDEAVRRGGSKNLGNDPTYLGRMHAPTPTVWRPRALNSPGEQGHRHGQDAHALPAQEEVGVGLVAPEPEVDPDAGRHPEHEGEDEVLLPAELGDQLLLGEQLVRHGAAVCGCVG